MTSKSQTHPRRILTVVFLTVFIDLVGFGITIPMGPYLARDLGASSFQVGQLMAVYSLMQFLMSPIWGRLSDRVGRRPIMLVSIFGTAIAHLGFAWASEIWMLIAARAFAGFFAANIATAMACVADVSGPQERSKNMGLIGAAFGMGFLFGPLIGGMGGWVGLQLGTQPPFGMSFAAVIAAGFSVLNLVLAYVWLPETFHPANLKKRESRLALVTRYFRRPVTNSLMLVYFLSVLAMALMEPMMFLLMKDRFGWNLQVSSLGFAYVGLLMVLTQGFLIRRLLPRWGEKTLMFAGLGLMAVGLVGIGFAGDLAGMTLAVTALGLGNGLSTPATTGSVSLSAGAEEQGTVIGVTQSLASVSRILGPQAGGWLYGFHPALPFVGGGAMALLALMVVGRQWRLLPQRAKANQ